MSEWKTILSERGRRFLEPRLGIMGWLAISVSSFRETAALSAPRP